VPRNANFIKGLLITSIWYETQLFLSFRQTL
jgi:hypothetical protein